MAFEFEEQVEEKKDWTKAIWVGVACAFVLMILGMFIFTANKPAQSLVVARHILIACDSSDVADRTRALELTRELRQRIQNGESFAKLAKEYSGDPTTARSGGTLPPTGRGTYDKNFEEYVWTAPVGQLSEPVVTSFGFHLIEVLERNIHETELYEADLDRRATDLLREKNKAQRDMEGEPATPSAPETAPAEEAAPVAPEAAPAPVPPAVETVPAPAAP